MKLNEMQDDGTVRVVEKTGDLAARGSDVPQLNINWAN